MNIRHYFITTLQKKHTPLLEAKPEDAALIQQYLSPVSALFAENFPQCCESIFTIYQTQIAVFTHEQSYYLRLKAQLEQKHLEASAIKNPECLNMLKNDPLTIKMNLIGVLAQIVSPNVFINKRTCIELSDWLTQMVALRSARGPESTWSHISTLSFDSFRNAYMIHSEIPELTAALEKQETRDSYNAKFNSPEFSPYEEYKANLLALYQEAEQENEAYAQPLIEKGYKAYTACINYLEEAKAKTPTQGVVLTEKEAFSHLVSTEDDEGLAVGDNSFEKKVIDASKVQPVLVDFWASWCQPCKRLSPIIEEIDKELPGITVIKVEADKAPSTCAQLNIQSLPTLLLFIQGKEARRLTGISPADPKGTIIRFINESKACEEEPPIEG